MEDYRWAILRGRMKPWQFQLFNLLLHRAVPERAARADHASRAHRLAEPRAARPGGMPLFAVLFAAFLVGESVADQQQWDFHQAKAAAGGRLEPGFVTTGLFRISRHPNFFFEQAQWWAFYAIGATAAAASGLGLWGGALNWTIVGAVLLTLLFIGSTIFTESITASKYPAYADYRRTHVDARAAAARVARRRGEPPHRPA